MNGYTRFCLWLLPRKPWMALQFLWVDVRARIEFALTPERAKRKAIAAFRKLPPNAQRHLTRKRS